MLMVAAQSKCRVVLVDERSLDREGLETMLRAESGVEIVASERDCDRAISASPQGLVDVAVVDSGLIETELFAGIERLRNCYPGIRVVLLLNGTGGGFLDRVRDAGIDGVVSKLDPFSTLLIALHTARASQPYYSPQVAAH